MPTTSPTRTVPGWDRQRALQATIVQVERRYGRGAVRRLGDQPEAPVPVIPTGSLALDLALGVGGLPRGRISEVYGPEATGKTTIALSVIAQAQQAGGTALFIDAEHALDLAYARMIGVDVDRLLVCQPDSGEHALDVLEALVRSGALAVAVVDSVPALVRRLAGLSPPPSAACPSSLPAPPALSASTPAGRCWLAAHVWSGSTT